MDHMGLSHTGGNIVTKKSMDLGIGKADLLPHPNYVIMSCAVVDGLLHFSEPQI